MFSAFTPFDILVFVVGSVWLFKKVANMDRYQTLRTIVLTVIIGALVIYVIMVELSPIQPNTCYIEFESA